MIDEFEDEVKFHYDQSFSGKYRKSDKLIIENKDFKRICHILKEITCSFDHRKIFVLDIGCGTGRHFHCLKNVDLLVGIDLSPFMLEQARHPVLQEEITIKHIDLRCGNIFKANCSRLSFDFIYSCGVLGEHSPFDLFICNKLHELLRPGGKLFFTVADAKTQRKSCKRRIAERIYPLLPCFCKEKLDERWRSFYMTCEELEGVIKSSNFTSYEIDRHVSTAPQWKGAHWQCIAKKNRRIEG